MSQKAGLDRKSIYRDIYDKKQSEIDRNTYYISLNIITPLKIFKSL
jgi:hypothetical protein